MSVFMIIGRTEPVYELALPSPSSSGDLGGAGQYLQQFILHSSLDMLHATMFTNSATFLRVIDRFNALLVSAYVTPGGTAMLLLHNGKGEDAVRAFFQDAHEVFAKHMMNPFATFDTPITSPAFDSEIKSLAKKYIS